MSRYFHNVLVSVDQLANTLLASYPDETLSARSWRCRDKKRWAIMVKVINFLARNPHHCELAFTKEIDFLKTYIPFRVIKSTERCIMYTCH